MTLIPSDKYKDDGFYNRQLYQNMKKQIEILLAENKKLLSDIHALEDTIQQAHDHNNHQFERINYLRDALGKIMLGQNRAVARNAIMHDDKVHKEYLISE
jgi:hypothetical protein